MQIVWECAQIYNARTSFQLIQILEVYEVWTSLFTGTLVHKWTNRNLRSYGYFWENIR